MTTYSFYILFCNYGIVFNMLVHQFGSDDDQY